MSLPTPGTNGLIMRVGYPRTIIASTGLISQYINVVSSLSLLIVDCLSISDFNIYIQLRIFENCIDSIK